MWNNVIISQIEQEHEHFHSEDNMVLCHAKIALGKHYSVKPVLSDPPREHWNRVT